MKLIESRERYRCPIFWVTEDTLAARDGKAHEPGEIPDGFYLVDDARNPQPAFQAAIIDAVAKVTHIAEPDARGQLIGSPTRGRGVIEYEVRSLGLCAGLTGARFTTTTEVYPDSPRTTPEQCNEAQVTAVGAAFEFAVGVGAGSAALAEGGHFRPGSGMMRR